MRQTDICEERHKATYETRGTAVVTDLSTSGQCSQREFAQLRIKHLQSKLPPSESSSILGTIKALILSTFSAPSKYRPSEASGLCQGLTYNLWHIAASSRPFSWPTAGLSL
ncbi:hypothetical protein J6590_054642 [Homalodisca vitripennis]|nr:hypothetical protein J6590_054642 [Homalodisca vitripennis]